MGLKMSDIAKMTGVSKAAVSFALNGKPGVSDETRKKIFKVIKDQGYEPLRKHKKGGVRKIASISLIIIQDRTGMMNRSYASLPFFDTLVSELSQHVNGAGGQMQIVNLDINHLHEGLNNKALQQSKASVVLATDLNQKQIQLINRKLRNVIFVDNYFDDIQADFVSIDNFQGAYQAGKYIVKKGYRKIGYVASNHAISNFIQRRSGFRKAMKEANIQVPAEYVFSLNPTELIGSLPPLFRQKNNWPEAIFCEDDYMAVRLLKELTRQGIKIPKDIAVMGFDDIFEDTMVTPELTTMHVPITQIVIQAINQLQSKVADRYWLPQKCFISTKLVERESL